MNLQPLLDALDIQENAARGLADDRAAQACIAPLSAASAHWCSPAPFTFSATSEWNERAPALRPGVAQPKHRPQ
ncbi:hypothetical protein [Streptomyces erythrochromogenes]|uniref:hypothetical protein n=1 Tax=Streptomyces erythrochromogenes TaxID=285574 RepID=UPI00224E3B5F|nr:hypothetical protein [Streptomyces erythrochromogenes]MCX5584035.1 hypothetical protein [Streptomyces erythrochromogenes]